LDEKGFQLLGYQWLLQLDPRTKHIDFEDPSFGLIEIYIEHTERVLIIHISMMLMIKIFI
jgi:hypothetical protein